MELTLNAEQEALLREVLEGELGNLKMEITDTDNSRFKDQLRKREQVLLALITLVGPAA